MKYDYDLDLSEETSHSLMIRLVGSNKRVLDVGCATGYLSKALADGGCSVVGLEIDPAAAEEARQHCTEVVVGDIETLDLEATFGTSRFDVIVFGDVLEHLKEPRRVLSGARPLLVPEGYVVASVPNIAHGAVRLALMQGRFDYRDVGLLDETHLRFFTRQSLEELFKESGLAIAELRRTTAPIWETEIPLRREDFSDEVVDEVEADAESTTYQFVASAVVDNGLRSVWEMHEREQLQRTEIFELQRRLTKATEESARLIEELAVEREGYSGARQEIDAVRAELVRLRSTLAAQQEELAAHRARWDAFERKAIVRAYRAIRPLPS